MIRWLKRLYWRYKAWRLRGRPGVGIAGERLQEGTFLFRGKDGLLYSKRLGQSIRLGPGRYTVRMSGYLDSGYPEIVEIYREDD